MEFWDNIVHTALLGTEKKQLKKDDLPDDLADLFAIIGHAIDKEDQYLHMAAIALNYRKCGGVHVNKTIPSTVAENEVQVYCSSVAHRLLHEVISTDNLPLLELWLRECAGRDQIVEPEYIPSLFDLAGRHMQLQQLIQTVTGKRGKWLLLLNANWKFTTDAVDESLWQTGTPDQRKSYLKELRQKDADKAREQLQQVWGQENANTKSELVKLLSTNISAGDIEWLELLMNEKSQKVKDEALKLLKSLPASSIVQKYWEIVKQSVHLRKEKGLFAIGSKNVLEISLPENIEESIFKSGIQQNTGNKNVSDDDFVLYQLISAVPPSFFELHFALAKKEVIDIFLKSKRGRQLITAFGLSAIIFKEADWLREIIAEVPDQFYAKAFELLNAEEREEYAIRFIHKPEDSFAVIRYLVDNNEGEWSMKLAREFFKYTAKNQYAYNRSFYNQIILAIPEAIISELDTFIPVHDPSKNMWGKTSEYIVQLIELRTQIIQAFKS